MAVEVGIVGLSNAGKTTLFNALTSAGATTPGQVHVGMAPVEDARLDQVAATVGARKATPASLRLVDVPGTGAQRLGNLRRVDSLLAVLDGWSETRNPQDDLVALELELLLADREHVERRRERVAKQAKSGDAELRREVGDLERVLDHLDAERPLSEFPGALPRELEPLTVKPLIAVVNGPAGIDAKLEAELAELPAEEAEAFRERPSARAEVVGRLFEALEVVTFFTASEKEARAWTLRRGRTALDAAAAVHTDLARGFIRCEVVRWDDLVAAGSQSEAARRGVMRLEGKAYIVEDGDVLYVRFSPPR